MRRLLAVGAWIRWGVLLCSSSFIASCTTNREMSPESVIDAYRAALERRDGQAVWALSSETVRATTSPEALGAQLAKLSDEEIRAALAAPDLGGIRLVIRLNNGADLVLVREHDGYRIERGVVDSYRLDTPEGALRVFFASFSAKNLPALRRIIPQEAGGRFTSDSALSAHLEKIRARVERARSILGFVRDGTTVVDGTSARLTYGEGLEVTFVLEDGAWRVVDLE